MLSGATCSAAAIVGTAVFRIVVSSDSMKNATAISHGSSRLLESGNTGCAAGNSFVTGDGSTFVELGCIGLRGTQSSTHKQQLSPIQPPISISYAVFAERFLPYGVLRRSQRSTRIRVACPGLALRGQIRFNLWGACDRVPYQPKESDPINLRRESCEKQS